MAASATIVKAHLHSEQYDGWLHAECGAGEWRHPSRRCLGSDDFERLPRAERCSRCTRYWWPRGGDPLQGEGRARDTRRADREEARQAAEEAQQAARAFRAALSKISDATSERMRTKREMEVAIDRIGVIAAGALAEIAY